jgi:NADPH-dependent curcumin reductase CurA
VVSLIATDPTDGGAASASQVTFNGSVQGKVSGIDAPSSTLFVLGQTVHVTSQTVFGSNIKPAGLSGLQSGDVVEVSGFANSVGEFVATRIEAKGQSNVSRVVGSVHTLDQTGHTFYVNSLKIDYGNAEVDAVLTDSAPVTVQGVKFDTDGALIANLVRASATAHGQPGSIGRLQGLITSYSSSAYFEVNGQPVLVGAQTKLNLPVPIGLDVEVNVTGTFDTNGVLAADSVQSSK